MHINCYARSSAIPPYLRAPSRAAEAGMVTPPAHRPSQTSMIRMEADHLCAKVKVLPDHIFANPSPYPVVVQVALLESFYVSVRTLIEFLEIRPAKRDVSATSTLPGWKPTLSLADTDRFLAHWETVSKHLVHFSPARTQPIPANEFEVRQLAVDVLAVWDQFAAASDTPLVPTADRNHLYDTPSATPAAEVDNAKTTIQRFPSRLRCWLFRR